MGWLKTSAGQDMSASDAFWGASRFADSGGQIVGLAVLNDAMPTHGHLSLRTREHRILRRGASPEVKDKLCYFEVADVRGIGSFGHTNLTPECRDVRLEARPLSSAAMRQHSTYVLSEGIVDELLDLPVASMCSGSVHHATETVLDCLRGWHETYNTATLLPTSCMKIWVPQLLLMLHRNWSVAALPFCTHGAPEARY